ncbi:MAG: adaptor protein MecA [Lachnospiraceae bacterium]|nr:adaptor protein MecA [Lachnospiraceae bacterium]
MKIEKINDNQIRCILTREDLEQRQIRLSELAYGSDKAKSLFQDMMRQAAFQFGFQVENMPVMIEAIPLSSDSIVLVVTKVENPEELDARFSSFGPSIQNSLGQSGEEGSPLSPFEQLLNSLKKDLSAGQTGASSSAPERKSQDMAQLRRYLFTHRLFSFTSLRDLVQAASLTGPLYRGTSALYQNPSDRKYYLFLTMPDMDTVKSMQHVLAVISEYGHSEPISYAREQHLKEHCVVICPEDALTLLSSV